MQSRVLTDKPCLSDPRQRICKMAVAPGGAWTLGSMGGFTGTSYFCLHSPCKGHRVEGQLDALMGFWEVPPSLFVLPPVLGACRPGGHALC